MTLATIEKLAKGYLTFFKAHERFLTLVLAGALLFHFYGKGLDAWVDHDKRVATVAAQQEQAQGQANQQLQVQLKQLSDLAAQQAATIQQDMQQRAQETATQKKTDDQMTPTDLTARLQKLLNVGPQEVQWSPITGDITFDPAAAHTDADDLEDLAQLKSDNTDLKTELTNEQSVNAKQTELISGTQQQLADEKKSHQDDVNTLKAENHQQYVKGLKRGLYIGVFASEGIRLLFTHKL